MVFAAINPRHRIAGTPLENVAEEVLNGFFCHYEPPTSEYAQHKASIDARLHPKKYAFSQVKKNQSILRTSRLYRKKRAAEAARQKRKGVTWRDEHNRAKGLEGKVESCAADCDFLGLTTKVGKGLADTLSPTQGQWKDGMNLKHFEDKVEACTANCKFFGNSSNEGKDFTECTYLGDPDTQGKDPTACELLAKGYTDSISAPRGPLTEKPVDVSSSSVQSVNEGVPPKKVLYDDEGNPIADENTEPNDALDGIHPSTSAFEIPPAPTGMSQLRKMAKQLDDGVYEPENYDQPHRPQSLAYKRIRSPPLRRTPRHNEVYGDDEDKITMTRSQSPIPNDIPNHYDTPEQFDDNRNLPRGRAANRPATPHRRRSDANDDGMDYVSNKDYRHSPDQFYDNEHGRTNPVSPSRRSDVFSDLTMDEAIAGRSMGYRHRPISPARTSEGVEVDMFRGRARPRSRSPSRYQYDSQYETESRKSSTDESYRPIEYDTVHDSSSLSNRSSRDTASDKRRRHSTDEPPKNSEVIKMLERKASNRSRLSEPLPATSRQQKRQTPDEEVLQQLRKLPSRQTAPAAVPAVATDYASEHEMVTAIKRDPTPRMSLDPTTGDENKPYQGPLPPTPRRKDADRRSSREARDTEEDPRSRGQRSTREEREKDAQFRSRLSRTRDEPHLGQTSGCSDSIRQKPLTCGALDTNQTDDWAYNALLKPFSPKSVATDDEIRAEVSSVGMESNTLRPIQYPNPFVAPSEPTINELRRPEDVTSKIGSEPSSISYSTLSSHEKPQPIIKKVQSADTGRRSRDVSNSSGSSSSKTKKLWKGWRKAVGKVKAIVKDIDEQRIPAPFLPTSTAHSGYLQPQHPTSGTRKTKVARATTRS